MKNNYLTICLAIIAGVGIARAQVNTGSTSTANGLFTLRLLTESMHANAVE